MRKMIYVLVTTALISACSIVPYHKSGEIKTDQTTYHLTGGHMVINNEVIHFLDKSGDITVSKKQIREMHLNY